MQLKWNLFVLFMCSSLCVQCANVFEPLADKTSDKILIYDAKQKITERKFVEALAQLDQLSAKAKTQNDVKVLFASAHAGSCGLEFITFFNSISKADLSGTTLFKFLRSSFTDKATIPNQCLEAEKKIKDIGPTEASRLAAMGGQKDVNMLMALIAMAKVGGILRVLSDSDGANSRGDGTTDAGFDACDTNDLPDDDVIEVATGFGLLIENISSLLGSGSSTETTLNAVSAAVDLLCDPGSTYNFTCVIRDESEIEAAPPHRANLLNSYRLLLDNKDLGIGSCDPTTNPGGCC